MDPRHYVPPPALPQKRKWGTSVGGQPGADAAAGAYVPPAAAGQPLVAGQAPAPAGAVQDRYVWLRGLPFSAGEPEVRAFLGGQGIEAVHFLTGPDGRGSGEAAVALISVDFAALALQRDRTYMGHRYVEVYPSTADEFMRGLSRAAPPQQGALPQQGTLPPQGVGGTVLRMRGLPFSASVTEIAGFWTGFAVVRVSQVPLGADGRPSGEAYAEFASPEECSRALAARQRAVLGSRYVELYSAPLDEMLSRAGEGHAVQVPSYEPPRAAYVPPRAAYVPPQAAYEPPRAAAAPGAPEGCVVRMRGLPYQATAGDIARFFAGYALARVLPVAAPQHGRPSGEAYVEFASPAESARALHERQRGLLGTRYIELFSAPAQEMDAQIAHGQSVVEVGPGGSLHEGGSGGGWGGAAAGLQRQGAPPRGARPQPPGARPEGDLGTVLLMRGLPYSATMEDIISFFAGCGVARVVPTMGPGGRSTGEAYVEFASAAESDGALGTHQHGHIGTRYVELFPAPLADLEAAEAAHSGAEAGYAGVPAGGPPPQQSASSPVLLMRGLPFEATTDDISAFFSGLKLANIVPVVPEEGRPNKGEAYIEFAAAKDCSQALQDCQHKYMGTRYILLFPATPEEMRRKAARAVEADRFYAQSAYQGPPQQQPSRRAEVPPRAGESGPLLRMRGLPFEATPEDIARFFEGYSPLRVVLGAASFNGRPSGEAFAEFATAEDAERARAERHRATMGTRWIELYPCSQEEFDHAAQASEPLDAAALAA